MTWLGKLITSIASLISLIFVGHQASQVATSTIPTQQTTTRTYLNKESNVATTSILDINGKQSAYLKVGKNIYSLYSHNSSVLGMESDTLMPEVDLSTFRFIYDSTGSSTELLAEDKNSVYFEDQIVQDADPGTFNWVGVAGSGEIIESTYFKDKNHVYWSEEQGITEPLVIIGADPLTFRLAAPFAGYFGNSTGWMSCGDNCNYDALDKNHKYLNGKVVQ